MAPTIQLRNKSLQKAPDIALTIRLVEVATAVAGEVEVVELGFSRVAPGSRSRGLKLSVPRL